MNKNFFITLKMLQFLHKSIKKYEIILLEMLAKKLLFQSQQTIEIVET